MISADGVFQFNRMNARSRQYGLGDLLNIQVYASNASVGGASSEVLTITGLASTDTLLAIHQRVKGANSTALIANNTLTNNALTCVWTGDPGAGAIIMVTVLKAAS